MKPFAALLSALLPIVALAAQSPPDQTPPRAVVEDQLRIARADLADAEQAVQREESEVREKDSDVDDAKEALDETKDKILEYQQLLFDHQSRADDPWLTPAQRRELDRATRATRAHLQKLDQMQNQERRELLEAQDDLRRARAACQEARNRVRAITVQVQRLEKLLAEARR